jgi:hypothetical protein
MELDFAAAPSGGFTAPGSPRAEGTAISRLKSSEFGSVNKSREQFKLARRYVIEIGHGKDRSPAGSFGS